MKLRCRSRESQDLTIGPTLSSGRSRQNLGGDPAIYFDERWPSVGWDGFSGQRKKEKEKGNCFILLCVFATESLLSKSHAALFILLRWQHFRFLLSVLFCSVVLCLVFELFCSCFFVLFLFTTDRALPLSERVLD